MPAWVMCESLPASLENSLPPQLIDSSLAPGCWLPTSTALNKLVKLLVAASTKTIFALGAMACAHSISSAASCAHPQFLRGCAPVAYTTWKALLVEFNGSVEVSTGRQN